jgi:hypothetical protein
MQIMTKEQQFLYEISKLPYANCDIDVSCIDLNEVLKLAISQNIFGIVYNRLSKYIKGNQSMLYIAYNAKRRSEINATIKQAKSIFDNLSEYNAVIVKGFILSKIIYDDE